MGKMIVIEGLDGSGKGTQAALLAEYLREKGEKVCEISFPDYDSEGSALVRMYLGGALGTDPSETNAYAASMFFAADRYVSYRTGWKKAYEDPETVVIANRYTTANAYHQISKLPRHMWDAFLDWLWDFEFHKLGLPIPDTVIALSMPPRISEKMIEKRCEKNNVQKDIHEADREYLHRCYDALTYTAGKMGWTVLDASDGENPYPIDVMKEKIREVLGI